MDELYPPAWVRAISFGRAAGLLRAVRIGAVAAVGLLRLSPSTQGATLTDFPTQAALRAFDPSTVANDAATRVRGHSQADDGGGGSYVWDSSCTLADDGGSILQSEKSPRGRWLLVGDVLTPELFGAKGDGAADDTAAMVNLFTALSRQHGGTVRLPAGKCYRVFAPKGGTLFTLTDGRHVIIDGPNATIVDAQSYSGTESANLFRFINCMDVKVRLSVRTQHYTVDKQGLASFTFLEGCRSVEVDARIEGGTFGCYLLREASDPVGYASGDITVNIRASHTEYPVLAARSGFNLTGKIEATNSGRNFFLFGTHHVQLSVNSKNQQGASLIAAFGGDGCSDVSIQYRDRDSDRCNPNNEALLIQYTDETPATMRNIRLAFDVVSPVSSPFFATVGLLKLNNLGKPDAVGRGHILDGLEISGYSKQTNRAHFYSSGAFAAPDRQMRINVHDLTLDAVDTASSGFAINLGALEGSAEFTNVIAPKSEVSGCNGSNGVVSFVACTARYFSPGGDTNRADNHEYHRCTILVPGGQSLVGKRFKNTMVGTSKLTTSLETAPGAGSTIAFQLPEKPDAPAPR